MATTEWQPSELQRSRDAYRRHRTRRSAVIGLLVTALVVLAQAAA